MKKYIVLFITISLFFTSCNNNETDYLFDKSINERTAELKSQYSNILTDSPNGWIGYYAPNDKVGTIAILFKFDKNGNVVLKSDFEGGIHDLPTTYRIDKTLKIELVFESNTVLHAIYEINNNDNEGEYVFNIISATADKVILQSKTDNGYNGETITTLELKPAKASDWDLSSIEMMQLNIQGDPLASVWRSVNVNGNPISTFFYDTTNRAVTFTYLVDDKLQTTTVPISITSNGFCLLKEIVINGVTLNCFDWNNETKFFEDKAINASISFSTKPLIVTNDYKILLNGNNENAYGYIGSYLATAPTNSPFCMSLIAAANAQLPSKQSISRIQLIFNSDFGNYIEYRFNGGKTSLYHNVIVTEDAANKTLILTDDYWDDGSQIITEPVYLKDIDKQLLDSKGLYVKKESFSFGGPPNTIYTFTNASDGKFRLTTYAFQ